jgi:hypothetical protein
MGKYLDISNYCSILALLMRLSTLKHKKMKEVEKVIKTGVHTCSNGITFPYEVTNFDMVRKEVTVDFQVNLKMGSGEINPMEMFRLLTYLYPTNLSK